ncbi:hypothetical protein [Microlunatus elymi]|uniref:hypothetical protein n=1 Tax=Microlunatus elymi TaxID=2596828 RepID=UPI00143DB2D4|nr:hypothetical protein [Microlunatus elymi]
MRPVRFGEDAVGGCVRQFGDGVLQRRTETAQRPEQLGIVVRGHPTHAPVRGHQFDGTDSIGGVAYRGE